MDKSYIAQITEELVEAYRSALLLDPFIKITVDIGGGDDFISKCYKDKQPLSWVVKINPDRHSEVSDIQYSVIQSILEILFSDMDMVKENSGLLQDVTARVVSRLATAISMLNLFELNSEDAEVKTDEED